MDYTSDFKFSDGTDQIGPEKLDYFSSVKGQTRGAGFVYYDQPMPDLKKLDPKVVESLKSRISLGQNEVIEKDGHKFLRAPRFIYDDVHWTEDTGRFRCFGGDCCKLLNNDSKTKKKSRILTLVVESALDKQGAVKKPISANWELKILSLTKQLYDEVRRQNMNYPMLQNDYMLTCTSDQFKSYTVAMGKGSAWRSDAEVEEEIMAQAVEQWEVLDRLVGRHMTEEEFREKMNLGMANAPAVNQTLSADQQAAFEDLLGDDL